MISLRWPKKNNVIVLLFDNFSNTVLEDAMAENPEVAAALKDFTYYDNADSHFFFTFPSLIHILTGTEYDYNVSKTEWMESCWNTERCENFYASLHSLGYECDLYYTDPPLYIGGSYENMLGKIDNVAERERRIRTGLLIRLLEKMTIYKYVPYVLKPRFEVQSHVMGEAVVWEFDDTRKENGVFYETMIDEGISVDESLEGKFSFNYLTGMHGPRQTQADGRLSLSEEQTSIEETSAGICVIIMEYIEQLKEAGVYDDATIIITSDHGRGVYDPQIVYFIKTPGTTREELAVSGAPVSHDDFQATILDVLGQSYEEYGTSVFDWADGDARTRELWLPLDNDYVENGFLIYTYNTDRYEIMSQTQEDAVPVTCAN